MLWYAAQSAVVFVFKPFYPLIECTAQFERALFESNTQQDIRKTYCACCFEDGLWITRRYSPSGERRKARNRTQFQNLNPEVVFFFLSKFKDQQAGNGDREHSTSWRRFLTATRERKRGGGGSNMKEKKLARVRGISWHHTKNTVNPRETERGAQLRARKRSRVATGEGRKKGRGEAGSLSIRTAANTHREASVFVCLRCEDHHGLPYLNGERGRIHILIAQTSWLDTALGLTDFCKYICINFLIHFPNGTNRSFLFLGFQ